MSTTKRFDSRFGDGGTADGLPDANHDAGGECELNDQYAEGRASKHWGVRTVGT